jgi:hypothetical protein
VTMRGRPGLARVALDFADRYRRHIGCRESSIDIQLFGTVS